ncbi:hypothetical protein F4782DRAFT_425676 [Xylaria castorea]|nr:hypothetical protein F4782DRAFT_425676 [Xylaria castorea]
MHALSIIFTSLLVSLGATIPVLSAAGALANSTTGALANSTKVWTLDEVYRKVHHKGQTCKWKFVLTESMSPPSYSDNDIVARCHFKVRALKGQDCRAGNFGLTQCSHGDPDFFVSGGHDKDGFLTLIVSNTYENADAFFGYLDADLDAHAMIPSQTSPIKTHDKTE